LAGCVVATVLAAIAGFGIGWPELVGVAVVSAVLVLLVGGAGRGTRSQRNSLV
jgi:hypothetical protein